MTQEEKAKAYDEALERARRIKNGEGDWRYSDLIEITPALTDIFPQLSESEDERIRKAIMVYLDWLTGFPDYAPKGDFSIRDMLYYLEKQKELMPPVNVDPCDASWYAYYQRGLNKGYELGLEAGRKEQKPHEPHNWPADKDNLTQEQKPELVQQPPITYTYKSNASRDERLKAALLALLNSDLLKVKEGGYFTKQDLIEWVERIPTDKPAEWSEEDERNRDRAIFYTSFYQRNEGTTKGSEECIDWLKSLRPSWKPSEVKWLVDDDYDELTDKGRFILGSVGIGYNGYYIPYSDLLKLQKED